MTLIASMLMVVLGGAVGALARFGCQKAAERWTSMPGWMAIFFINIFGSFCIGLSVGWIQELGAIDLAKDATALMRYQNMQEQKYIFALFVVGLCGGYTTFSTFSLDNLFLLYKRPLQLGFNITASVLLATLAAWGGLALGGGLA